MAAAYFESWRRGKLPRSPLGEARASRWERSRADRSRSRGAKETGPLRRGHRVVREQLSVVPGPVSSVLCSALRLLEAVLVELQRLRVLGDRADDVVREALP